MENGGKGRSKNLSEGTSTDPKLSVSSLMLFDLSNLRNKLSMLPF